MGSQKLTAADFSMHKDSSSCTLLAHMCTGISSSLIQSMYAPGPGVLTHREYTVHWGLKSHMHRTCGHWGLELSPCNEELHQIHHIMKPRCLWQHYPSCISLEKGGRRRYVTWDSQSVEYVQGLNREKWQSHDGSLRLSLFTAKVPGNF